MPQLSPAEEKVLSAGSDLRSAYGALSRALNNPTHRDSPGWARQARFGAKASMRKLKGISAKAAPLAPRMRKEAVVVLTEANKFLKTHK